MDENYIVVDLCNREDYDNGHIENAICIEDATLDDIMKYDRKDLIWVLYCYRGSLSFQLANEMAKVGYKVMAVVGGYKK
jgi:rhodanese-related sulfurtransferase